MICRWWCVIESPNTVLGLNNIWNGNEKCESNLTYRHLGTTYTGPLMTPVLLIRKDNVLQRFGHAFKTTCSLTLHTCMPCTSNYICTGMLLWIHILSEYILWYLILLLLGIYWSIMRAFHQGWVFFQLARSGRDCPRWINCFVDRPDCRPESPRQSVRQLFLDMLKNSSQSKTVVLWSSWSSEELARVGCSPPSTLRTTLGRGRARQRDPQGTVGRPRRPRDDCFWSATVFQHV